MAGRGRLRGRGQGVEELLGGVEGCGIGEEAEGARVPADGVLGAEPEGGGYLALIERGVRRRGEVEGVRKTGRLVAIEDDIPAGVFVLRLNGKDAEDPAAADGRGPLLPGRDFSLDGDAGADAGGGMRGNGDEEAKKKRRRAGEWREIGLVLKRIFILRILVSFL